VKKIVILSYFLAFDAPVRGFPSEYRDPVWTKKLEWCLGVIKLFLVWFMLILVTFLFLAPASTLVVINLNSTSAKPLAAYVPISLVSE